MKKIMTNLVIILMILGFSAVNGLGQDNAKDLINSVKSAINAKVEGKISCKYSTENHVMYLFNKKSSSGNTKMVLRVSDLIKVTGKAGRIKREIKFYAEPSQNTEKIEVLITSKDFKGIKLGYYYVYVDINTGKILDKQDPNQTKKPNIIAIKAMREILKEYEAYKN